MANAKHWVLRKHYSGKLRLNFNPDQIDFYQALSISYHTSQLVLEPLPSICFLQFV